MTVQKKAPIGGETLRGAKKSDELPVSVPDVAAAGKLRFAGGVWTNPEALEDLRLARRGGGEPEMIRSPGMVGEAPLGVDPAAPDERQNGARSPWYHVHTGTLAIYPHGVQMVPKSAVLASKRGHGPGGGRGKIVGLSAQAAGRLRQFVVKQEVAGRVPIAVTLTTHGIMSPVEWRKAWMRFRVRAVRAGVPFVWRVELQRRKAPHVHLVAWVDPWRESNWEVRTRHALPYWLHRRLFSEGWLECVREDQDPESQRHAVAQRELENHGWLVYLALHSGKHKAEQSGWEGKQWGIVNAGMFSRRVSSEIELTDSERYRLQRVFRRLLAKGGPVRVLPSRGPWLRCISADLVERAVWWVKGAVREAASESDAKKAEAAAVGL